MLRNMPHERRPELHHAGSMKSRVSAISMSEGGDGWVIGGWEVGRYRSAGRAHGDNPHLSSNPTTLLYVVRRNQ